MQLYFSYTQDDQRAFLDADESRHLTKVLRIAEGTTIRATDGKGTFFTGPFFPDRKDQSHIQIAHREALSPSAKPQIWLVVAPTKNMDRLEWLVEKATEIGIAGMFPIICKRSERKVLKIERLRRVALAAMKQSQQAFLPEILEAVPLETALHYPFPEPRYIAHCMEQEPRHALGYFASHESGGTIMIGPEGDFTLDEVARVLEHKFQPVSLGATRLRTETAALYAVCKMRH
jgi:16S rRNA (uracil1498-N3)-methyltransferase